MYSTLTLIISRVLHAIRRMHLIVLDGSFSKHLLPTGDLLLLLQDFHEPHLEILNMVTMAEFDSFRKELTEFPYIVILHQLPETATSFLIEIQDPLEILLITCFFCSQSFLFLFVRSTKINSVFKIFEVVFVLLTDETEDRQILA